MNAPAAVAIVIGFWLMQLSVYMTFRMLWRER
jgi:hypothetical protein